jgi:arabinofuranosyltransferase
MTSARPTTPTPPQIAKLTTKDIGCATSLMIATAIFVWTHIHHPILPMEDASMLLRYSQNVARGHGIVWNVGEHPVEGATDFLFMWLIGAIGWVTKVGVKPVAAGLLLLSHVASVGILYVALRKLYRAPMLVAGGFAVILATGLGYHFVDTAFSAPFYGLFALMTWCVGTSCIAQGVTFRRALLFAILGFTTGLIRPDGVILAGLMLCSAVYGVRSGWNDRLKLIACFGAIFAVCGGAYFAWRLHYFGYPFPNPYYIKHATGGRLSAIKLSTRAMVEMLLPVLPFVALGLRSRAAFRSLFIWLITVVPFTAVWMMISLDNNHFSRFQYVMVPLSLLALGGLTSDWWRELQGRSDGMAKTLALPLGGILAALIVVATYYNMHLYLRPFSNLGAQNLAARLKPYAAKNYSMVMTEAGDLPFYSEWRAVDAYGLNDEYIAHHNRRPSPEYLDTYRPEIIMYRVWGDYVSVAEFQAQLGGPAVETKSALTTEDMILDQYARQRGYVIAAIWGARQCVADVYWVRSDFADRDAIISAIRDHPYYTQEEGMLAADFRGVPAPTAPCTAR